MIAAVSRWLFDTDHVSLHERGHLTLRSRLETAPPESIAVSVVTVEEMIRGRLGVLARRAEGQARVHAYGKFLETVLFFGSIPVVPFDAACEAKFQELRALRRRTDLRIAATAIVNDLILVTRNQKDYAQLPGLRFEDWSQP